MPELGTSAIPIFSLAHGYSPKYFSKIWLSLFLVAITFLACMVSTSNT